MSAIELSLIVPCYNEEDMLPVFLREVVPVLDHHLNNSWEILVVDDGSIDRTREIVVQANMQDPRIKGVFLSRNFGHQAALAAGLAYGRGDFVGVIDCDLQDPITILVSMFNECKKGVDVCYGVREKRDAPFILKFCYSIFYLLMNKFSSHTWPRDAGDFCVMSSRVLSAIMMMPERSRMLRGLRSWVGFSQMGFPYVRPRRHCGKSKYNLHKLFDLAMVGFVGFSDAPLRLIGLSGFLVGFIALLIMMAVILNRIFPNISVLGYWVGASPMAATILVIFLFFMSLIFIFLAIIGEYIRILLLEVKGRPIAMVRMTIGDLPLSTKHSFALFPGDVQDHLCAK